jgi:hypothetical protein
MVRISQVYLDKPRLYKDPKTGKEANEPKYKMSMIVDAADMLRFKREIDGKPVDIDLEAECKAIVKQKWPELSLQEMFPKKPDGSNDWPLKKGDKIIETAAKAGKKSNLDFLAGKYQIGTSASVKVPPRLSYFDPKQGKVVDLDRDNPEDLRTIKKLFMPGNYVVCELSVVPNEVNGKCYLTFYLNHVRFKKAGERIGGGTSMMDRFEGIDGGEGDVDPTAGDEDFGSDDI